MTRGELAAMALLLLVACAPGRDAAHSQNDASSDRDTAPVVASLPPCEPTLASIQQNIFQLTCQWPTCHGHPTPAWGLVLVDPDVAQHLVGVASGSCPGWMRVVPGSPEQSLLYEKISSDHPPCGARMPWGPEILPESSIRCVRDWISSLSRVDASSLDASDSTADGASTQ